jgi:hypothetical protein
MWCRSYRDHAIMPFPSFDALTRSWLCQANITWVASPNRESAFVRFQERVQSEADAVSQSLIAAQLWIDKRLDDSFLAGDTRLPRGEIATVKKRASLPRVQKAAKPAARTLTFEQFKSFLKSYCELGGEQSLQKSYQALLRLRKKRHRSWNEITPKLRHLGEPSVSSRSVKVKAKRLPLTTRDWRRII